MHQGIGLGTANKGNKNLNRNLQTTCNMKKKLNINYKQCNNDATITEAVQ